MTLNLKDFPSMSLRGYGLEAITPDELVCRLLERLREVGLEEALARLMDV